MSNTEMWYERHLRMRQDQPKIIQFLLWIGFVKFGRKSTVCDIDENGELKYRFPETIIWPFSKPTKQLFRYHLRQGPRVYVFRNVPGIIKYVPGRLMPRRWGFGVCGFEFGDRG